MKNLLTHLQDTKIWMGLVQYVTSLRDPRNLRRLARHMPLLRDILSEYEEELRIISVRDYIVPCIRDRVGKKANGAHIDLRRIQAIGAVHDSYLPPADITRQRMRAVTSFRRLTTAEAIDEYSNQGLRPPTVSELVDFLIAYKDTVTIERPMYAVFTEANGLIEHGRVIHHVLRAGRDALGLLFIEMPTDLFVRRKGGTTLLPPKARVLGVSIRPLADILSLSSRTSRPDGSSEPA